MTKPMTMHGFRPGAMSVRWLLTVAVVMAPLAWGIGIAARMSGYHGGDRVGRLVVYACLLIVIWFSAFRSRPVYPSGGPLLDEREISVRRLAVMRGMAITAMPGVLACFYMDVALQSGWPTPSAEDWQGLLFVMVCWIFGMPMMFANWQSPAPLDDEDDQ